MYKEYVKPVSSYEVDCVETRARLPPTDCVTFTVYFSSHNFSFNGPLKFCDNPVSDNSGFWAVRRPTEKSLLVITVDESEPSILPKVHNLVTDIVRNLGKNYSNFGQIMVLRYNETSFEFAPRKCDGSFGVFTRNGLDEFFIRRKQRPYFTAETTGCLANGELVSFDDLFVSNFACHYVSIFFRRANLSQKILDLLYKI